MGVHQWIVFKNVGITLSTVSILRRYSNPITGLEWPTGFQEVMVPRFHDNGI